MVVLFIFMIMSDVLIVSATRLEILPLLQNFGIGVTTDSDTDLISLPHTKVSVLITGVGIHRMTFSLTAALHHTKPGLLVNAGIAGSFDPESVRTGDLVGVAKDRFGDLGAEDKDGSFLDIFDLGLDTSVNPFMNEGWITPAPFKYFTDLRQVKSITVNKVHGSDESIQKMKTKYNPDTESMEGAAFHFVAYKMNIPSVQIRAISNYVEPRNRNNWKINDAVQILNERLINFVDSF
jgi:futalosine hydrolase